MSLKNDLNNILFGQKESFAIELGMTKNPQKNKLRFWVKDFKIGSFTKADELDDSVRAYKKFTKNKESFYLQVFDHLTPTRILIYLTDFTLLLSERDEDLKEMEKRQELSLSFGLQFHTDTSFFFLLYKNNEVKFLYKPAKKETAKEYSVHYNAFRDVFEEYIRYCNSNNLLMNPNL